jgi:RNA polymerase sigma-70 factor (ECF subfamily)
VGSDEVERLYRAYSKEVYLYALALCKDIHAAEDLTSETFFRALLSFDARAGGVKYWLLRVCKNLYIDTLRKKRWESLPFTDAAEMVAISDCPLDTVLKDEAKRDLYRALLRLSETDREMLTMFYFLGVSISQIASILGRTAGAVKTGLTRARTRLKKILEETK